MTYPRLAHFCLTDVTWDSGIGRVWQTGPRKFKIQLETQGGAIIDHWTTYRSEGEAMEALRRVLSGGETIEERETV